MDSLFELCFESERIRERWFGRCDLEALKLGIFEFRRSIMPFVVQPRFDVGSLLSSIA
jgi:hypothetical protein